MISYLVAGGQYSLNFKLKTHSEQMENDISVLAGGLAVTQQTINSTLALENEAMMQVAPSADALTFIVQIHKTEIARRSDFE